MYQAAENRYGSMEYKRSGRSGVLLPRISLGLWQNFGLEKSLEEQEAVLFRAFDMGITHFDLANNYGFPAVGKAGKILVPLSGTVWEGTGMSCLSPQRQGLISGRDHTATGDRESTSWPVWIPA